METYGLISLLPILIVIVCAVITKRAAESLLLGTLCAAVIFAVGEAGFLEAFSHPLLTNEAADGTITNVGVWAVWFNTVLDTVNANGFYIIMFGMFGTLIRLLDQSGAAAGFSDLGAKFIKGRKTTHLFAFVLGVIIFVDDYLNALGVGVATRRLSDRHKGSREMLAYVTNTTGAAVCILVPFSSWAILYMSQIKDTGLFGENATGFSEYIQAIPFMLYSWIALLCVLLFIFVPKLIFGPMKKANLRAETTGRSFPDWYYEEKDDKVEETTSENKAGWWNFAVPMLVLIVAGLVCAAKGVEYDIVLWLIIATVAEALLLIVQRKLTLGSFFDSLFNGFKDMLYVTVLVILAFALQAFNDNLGLTPYVIENVKPLLSAAVFPAIVFTVVALLSFATGSFWGVAAIAFPIILPLAQSMDVNLFIAIGAVASATAFGSHVCFYSDAVTVTAAATGIKNIDYAKTAIPLIGVSFVISIVAFLILGVTSA
jgi:Na+/H+ antiporter NhaC